MIRRLIFVFTILAVITLLLQGGYYNNGLAATTSNLEGKFLVVWGDGFRGSNKTTTRYFLGTEQYGTVELLISNDLLAATVGIVNLNRKTVVLTGVWHEPGKSFFVGSILPVGEQVLKPEGVYGPQPWVSILCKFADNPAEPEDLNFFKQMYGQLYPGLDHFWRQNSYEKANLLGSNAFGWYDLPQPRSYYVHDGYLEFEKAASDCTEVADSDVYYPNFVGVNLMFNDDLDGYAWGGGWPLCLDDLCQVWRMTWEPPWGYQNIGVIAHETGHGFGLPHSLGNCMAGYDNRWDVMSDVWSNGTDPNFPQFGTMGQHTISYHKEILDWITTDQQYTAYTGTRKTITLERLAVPQTGNYLEARILIDNGTDHFYTLEVRQPANIPINYDKWLPGFAVIIHDIVPARLEPAVVIDQDGNCDTADQGAMYTPGEVFTDAEHGITVSIDSATATGYVVTISDRYTPMQSVMLTGPETGSLGESIPFTATVSPADASLPITYTWQATGLSPVVHQGGIVDNVGLTWDELGTKTITVTASNSGGSVVDTHAITIESIYPVVSIDGPSVTSVGIETSFTATSEPTDLVPPITYTWMVDGVPVVIHTGGLSDSLNFTWELPGMKLVEVTAENIYGSTRDSMPVLVRMAPKRLAISGRDKGFVGKDYAFTASVLPITTTVPLTYVWAVDGEEVITHTSGITDTVILSWSVPGMHHISVLARNPVGNLVADWSVTIFIQIYMPLSLKN